MRRLHQDESGAALVVALIATVVMLGLGFALVAIVDVQNTSAGTERTRERGFNLTETVLTSEGFVLGRNWPASAVTSGSGTLTTPLEQNCSTTGATVGATLGDSPAAGSAAALIQNNLNAVYTDTAYTGATWKVNVCDDTASSTVWDEATLSNGTKNWDKNGNNVLWVRAESTVKGVRRAVAGLVQARINTALQPAFGLVSGNVSEDLSASASAIGNTTVVSGLTTQLINTNPVVAPDSDPAYPLPKSGVTGLRCGLLSNPSLQKSCVTGTIGALSAVPAVNTLVTNGAFTQYPTTTSTDPGTIGQLRAQSKAKGTYTALSAGATGTGNDPPANPPACTITGTPTSDTVVFIEKVGTGDQWCLIDVSTSRRYKALVIGSGRVVFRGDNNTSAPVAYSPTAAKNLFTGVVYALGLQIVDPNATTPLVELVRIEQGARIRGTVNADTKSALVATIPPDFNTSSLVTGLLCPGALCASAPLVTALGLSGAVDALVNGKCLVKVGLVCTVTLPALGASAVGTALAGQMSTYGSPIHSDVAVVKALTVTGASGVVPGTYADLQPSL